MFKWPSSDDIGPEFMLTCKNHPQLRWMTKHPTRRSLHYLGIEQGTVITAELSQFQWRECDCAFSDLMVMPK